MQSMDAGTNMAPPSRASLALRAAKKLELAVETILDVTPSTSGPLVASKFNAVYTEIHEAGSLLVTIKDLCDVGMNTYPNYPAVREAMIVAGNQIYNAKQDLEEIKRDILSTPTSDLIAWRDVAMRISDVASRIRAVQFVAKRKGKKEVPNEPAAD